MPRSRLSSLDRFRTHVNVHGPVPAAYPEAGPCHLWTASCFASGYGQFKVDGANCRAHRWLWRALRGPLTDAEVLDHWACDNRACVNLDHLRPTSHRDNVLRSGISLASINAEKVTCPAGHEYDGVTRQGWRLCRTCRAEQQRARRAAGR